MKKGYRDFVARLFGKKPPEMQVAALCRDESTGCVLLVTSRGTGRWIVPKGWPMAGRSLAEAAQQEAWEEAGVRGTIEDRHIGSYRYDKVHARGFSVPVEVRVFAMRVENLADEFPEADQRKRRWYCPDRAAELVAEAGLKKLLRSLPMAERQQV